MDREATLGIGTEDLSDSRRCLRIRGLSDKGTEWSRVDAKGVLIGQYERKEGGWWRSIVIDDTIRYRERLDIL